MNARSAELYLLCRKPGAVLPGPVEKAFRFTESNPELAKRVRAQEEFDAQAGGVIHALEPPDDLKRRLAEMAGHASAELKGRRPQFTVPILLTMACGLLSIIGLLVAMEMDRFTHFPGREIAERMIDSANSMSGLELEPVSKSAGQLGDWFYMHGFENYAAPPEFTGLPAVGLRVLILDGKPVAQVAIDEHNSLLYVFRASDFRDDIPQKADWITFDHEGWAGALRRRDDTCVLVIFRGGVAEMEKFLRVQRPLPI